MKLSAAEIGTLDEDAFMRHFGSLYEHSPWVARGAWDRRPFDGADGLRRAFEQTVLGAPPERRLSLIRSHPELAGREARTGTLTAESAGEQAAAGLDRLSGEEMAALAELNAAYRERFGFPLVVAVREHTKDSIFRQGRERLANDREQELDTAVREILKIGRLRLGELVSDTDNDIDREGHT
jgi:OHCU decarboxylase